MNRIKRSSSPTGRKKLRKNYQSVESELAAIMPQDQSQTDFNESIQPEPSKKRAKTQTGRYSNNSSRSQLMKIEPSMEESIIKQKSKSINKIIADNVDTKGETESTPQANKFKSQNKELLNMLDTSSFSKSAYQTYRHLKDLTKQQWNSYGLYQFDRSLVRNYFLIQGELDDQTIDQYFVRIGLEIYYVNINECARMEEIDQQKYKSVKVFQSKNLQHFKIWKDSIILVRTLKKLRVFQQKTIEPGFEYCNLLSEIKLQPQITYSQLQCSQLAFDSERDKQLENNVAHMELEKNKNLIYVLDGNHCIIKLLLDPKNNDLEEQGAYNCDELIIFFKLVTRKRNNPKWIVVWSKKSIYDEIGTLQLIEKESMTESKSIKSVETDLITSMSVTESGNQIVTGMKNGDIQIWIIKEKELKCSKKILKFHQKEVTALLCFDDNYLVSGSCATQDDRTIAFWDLQEKKMCGQIRCKGDILGFNFGEKEQLIVQSSDGIFLYNEVQLKQYRVMPPIQNGKLITSENICLFNDGLRYAAGFWETQLVISSFAKFKEGITVKDLTRSFKQKIIEVQTCNNPDQRFIFINTENCDDPKKQKNGVIFKLDSKDLLEVTQFALSEKYNKYSHKTFSVHGKQQTETLITCGDYGVLIFKSKGTLGTLLHQITPKGPSIDDPYFISCKFIQQLDAFVCGTHQGKIHFYKFSNMEEPYRQLNSKIDQNLVEHFDNLQEYEEYTNYSDIVSSEISLPLYRQYLAQGSQHGIIIVWRIVDLKKHDLPFAILRSEGAVIDLKFIQEKESGVNLLLSLHLKPNKVIIWSLRNMVAINQINLNSPGKRLITRSNNVYLAYVVVEDDKNVYGSNIVQIEIGFRIQQFNAAVQSLKNMYFLHVFNNMIEEQDEQMCDYLNSFIKHGCIDALHTINLFNFCTLNPSFVGFKQFLIHQVPCLIDSNDEGPSENLRKKGNIWGLNCMFEMVQGFTTQIKGKKVQLQLPLNQTMLMNGLRYQEDWVQEQAESESNLIVAFPIKWDNSTDVIFGTFKLNYMLRFTNFFWGYENVRIFENGSKFISKQVLEEHIDFQKSKLKNKKKIECKYITIPFNLTRGTKSSLNFLSNVQSLSDEALYSEFQIMIHYKWQQNQSHIMFHAVVFLIYAALIDFELITHQENLSLAVHHQVYLHPTITFILIGYTVIKVMYEISQLYHEGPKMYLGSHINFIEATGLILMLTYFSMKYQKQPEDHKEWKKWIGNMKGVFSLGSFCINYRALYHGRVFSKMMLTIMTIIDESIKYILGYIILLYFFIFIISISFFALSEKETSFINSYLEQYDVLYAGNQTNIKKMRFAALIIYFLQTNFMIIICMNIVISVLTDKYDMVMQRIDAINLLKRAEIMHEVESTLPFSEDGGSENYIFFLEYQNDRFIDNTDDENEVSKFRMLKNLLQGYHVQLKKRLNKLKKDLLANQKDEMIIQQERIAEIVEKKIEEKLMSQQMDNRFSQQLENKLQDFLLKKQAGEKLQHLETNTFDGDESLYLRQNTIMSHGTNIFSGEKRNTQKLTDQKMLENLQTPIVTKRQESRSPSPSPALQHSPRIVVNDEIAKIEKNYSSDPIKLALHMFKAKLKQVNMTPEKFYRMCDWNYGQCISVQEFEQGITDLKIEFPQEQLDNLIKILDEKQMNEISYDEFFGALDAYGLRTEKKSVQEMQGHVPYQKRASFRFVELLLDRNLSNTELFKLIDENASGSINLKEFRQAMEVFGFFEEKQIECLKNMFDRNKSQSIDRGEFESQLQKMKRIYAKYQRQEALNQIQ